MEVNCMQYRKSQELLALKIRLEKGIPDSKDKEDVEGRIRILEKELDLD